jgi:hypothetical protein
VPAFSSRLLHVADLTLYGMSPPDRDCIRQQLPKRTRMATSTRTSIRFDEKKAHNRTRKNRLHSTRIECRYILTLVCRQRGFLLLTFKLDMLCSPVSFRSVPLCAFFWSNPHVCARYRSFLRDFSKHRDWEGRVQWLGQHLACGSRERSRRTQGAECVRRPRRPCPVQQNEHQNKKKSKLQALALS